MIAELKSIKKASTWFFDVECYKNFFLLVFLSITGQYEIFCFHDKQKPLEYFTNIAKLKKFLNSDSKILFGYNNRSYDNYVTNKFLETKSLTETKQYSDALINQGYGKRNPFTKCLQEVLRDSFVLDDGIELYDVDLMSVLGIKHSLKICECILKMNSVQELPIKPDAYIEQSQILPMISYCQHDCAATKELFLANKVWEKIDMRLELCKLIPDDGTKQFKNIMSYAEPTLVSSILPAMAKQHANLHPKTSFRNKQPEQPMVLTVRDVLDPIFFEPDFFQTPQAKEMLSKIVDKVILRPKTDEELLKDEEGEKSINKGTSFHYNLKFGSMTTIIACGGVHSKNEPKIIVGEKILDFDVKSYYPSLILKYEVAPEAWVESFLYVYAHIKELRVIAKDTGNEALSEGLKLILNSTYGKLKSLASVIHNQKGRFQVVMNGQLWLIKLLDMIYFKHPDVNFLQANTDGITLVVNESNEQSIKEITKQWAILSDFVLEEASYKSWYMRDVNNYIAIKASNKEKRKGLYAEKATRSGGNKYPRVCVEAAIGKVMFGKDYEQYIRDKFEEAKTNDLIIHDFLIYGKTKTGLYYGDALQDFSVYRVYHANKGSSLKFTTKKEVKVSIGESVNVILNIAEGRQQFFETLDIKTYIEQAKSFVHELTGETNEIPKICYEAIKSNMDVEEYIMQEFEMASKTRLYDFVSDKKQKVTKVQIRKCIEIATSLLNENESDDDE